MSEHKLPRQQGKAGNIVSVHVPAPQPLVLKQMSINSSHSPLDAGLAPPPSFTTKLEAAPFLTPDVMPFSKMQIFHLSLTTNIPTW